MAEKQFKDPIYGYIRINRDIVEDVIDTPAFQRLKDIRQTSYAPLYPSAYHNRYAHSLGVYYLGKFAFATIKPQLEERFFKELRFSEEEAGAYTKKLQNIFELACLLHDIGHAPFSHTGETFYLDKEETLYCKLKEAVDSETFTRDFDDLGPKPAAHECMSGLVGLKTFPKYFTSEAERSLFVRCIIGLPVQFREEMPKLGDSGESKEEKQRKAEEYRAYMRNKGSIELANCVIGLLNSSIIDVDRLDYIIRDAETIGFQGVQIDYMRLLGGLVVVKYEGKLCIGYHKSALSVIESAVYAHDAERKWVQSHPAILYEMEALKNAMSSLTAHFSWEGDKNPIFCYESLTEEGKDLYCPVELLSEEAKNLLGRKLLLTEEAWALGEKGLLSDDWEFDEGKGILKERCPLSLLADEDILSLMKRFCKDELGYEYFARNRRRLPVWKSEAEFRALFQAQIGENSKLTKKLEKGFEGLIDYCQDKVGCPIVGEWIFEKLDKEEEEARISLEEGTIPESVYENMVKGIKAKRYWAEALKKATAELDIEFEFLILFQKNFISSFSPSLGEVPIYFPNVKEEDGVLPLKNVIVTLQPSEERRSNFFHLFYKPKTKIDEEKKKKIVQTIAAELIAKASAGYR